ncbi:MAG: type II and III secretion system protein family protein [Pseudomonadota bacterium]|nr:type II and III secretion system protein family protein [Pseudomonadota bacterium]
MLKTILNDTKKIFALTTAGGAALLLTSLLLVVPIVPHSAFASDIAPISTQAAQTGRFFRIALNKSAIVTLPAEAKEVVVGNNDIVDVQVRNKTTAYLFARKNGSTNIFFFDAKGQQIMALDLEVAIDTLALQNLIRRTLPGTRITVDVLGSNVVLSGVAVNALEATTAVSLANEYYTQVSNFGFSSNSAPKVVNTIKVLGDDQVMLQVKMVEIQRDVLKQWGVNFGAAINAGAFAFNLSNVNPFTNSLISAAQGYGASISDGNGNSFTSIVRAMESDGVLHTLAEPNLTAVSGQGASFKAGGEFPYQVCTGIGASGTCTIAFKNYGVGLDFTPTVLSAGRINLKIHTEVSELNQSQLGSSGGTSSVPSLITRSADTVLETPDGGSMMLAGLIRENTRQTINGTPGLRNLPVLGALFRSRDFISNQTELVVIVTPHIVRSAAQKQFEVPDKNFNQANDSQTIIMGRLNRIYGSKTTQPTGPYGGNVGYIVE